MADATSDASGSATETDATAQGTATGSATEAGEDTQAEQLLGDALEGNSDTDPDGADQLGDPGKRALETMKGKLRDAQTRQRELEAELAAVQQPGQNQDQDQGQGQTDREAIKAEAERAVADKYNQRVLRSEVQRAATGKLADPADALTFLDLGQFEVNESGDVDSEAITTALDGLLESKPYLAAQRQRFQGTGDGGARNGSSPKQITSREELANMSASERLQAERDGRLNKMLNR